MLAGLHIRVLFSLCLSLALLAGCAIQTAPAAPTIERVVTSDLATLRQHAEQAAAAVGKENVLVIFDIDNTILAMEQDLGSDQWYDWQKELQRHDGMTPYVVAYVTQHGLGGQLCLPGLHPHALARRQVPLLHQQTRRRRRYILGGCRDHRKA